ncbi:hypothetical protein Tco_0308721 [Tanacetum coccineum]
MPSPRPAAYSPKEVMYCYYHPHLTLGDGFDTEFKKIPSGESKVHIEVLSVLWGNRLPIPDGSLPLTPDVSVFKKVEGIPKVEIRLLALSVRTPDVYKGLKTKQKRWPLMRIDRLAFRLSSLWKAEWWCSDLVSMAWSCPDCPFFVNFSPGFLSMSGFVQFLHGDWSHIDVAGKNYEGSSKASGVWVITYLVFILFQDCTRSNDVDCNAYSFLCSCWLRSAYGNGSECVDWSQHVLMIHSLRAFSVLVFSIVLIGIMYLSMGFVHCLFVSSQRMGRV